MLDITPLYKTNIFYYSTIYLFNKKLKLTYSAWKSATMGTLDCRTLSLKSSSSCTLKLVEFKIVEVWMKLFFMTFDGTSTDKIK